MRRTDAKFLQRVLVLCLVGLMCGIGIVVAKQNSQIDQLIPTSIYRELLLFFAPLTALGLTAYSLQQKSFGFRSLLTETLVVLLAFWCSLIVSLPHFFLKKSAGDPACLGFGIWCKDADMVPNHLMSALAIAIVVALFCVILKLEKLWFFASKS